MNLCSSAVRFYLRKDPYQIQQGLIRASLSKIIVSTTFEIKRIYFRILSVHFQSVNGSESRSHRTNGGKITEKLATQSLEIISTQV